MKPFPTGGTLLTALVILAAHAGNALAGPISFDFQSQVYPVPNTGGSGMSLTFTPSLTGTGEAEIDGSQGVHVAGPSTISVAGLSLISHSDPDDPFQIGSTSAYDSQPFTLALTLTDGASHAQGSLLFQGSFGGSVGPGGASGDLSFTPGTQSLALGNTIYTVDLSQQTSWVGEFDGQLGASFFYGADVQAQVDVRPAPEPTSLTLTGLGLVTILGGGLHRRRRRKPAA